MDWGKSWSIGSHNLMLIILSFKTPAQASKKPWPSTLAGHPMMIIGINQKQIIKKRIWRKCSLTNWLTIAHDEFVILGSYACYIENTYVNVNSTSACIRRTQSYNLRKMTVIKNLTSRPFPPQTRWTDILHVLAETAGTRHHLVYSVQVNEVHLMTCCFSR